jgi:mono/diheme cytochrome c family protein
MMRACGYCLGHGYRLYVTGKVIGGRVYLSSWPQRCAVCHGRGQIPAHPPAVPALRGTRTGMRRRRHH